MFLKGAGSLSNCFDWCGVLFFRKKYCFAIFLLDGGWIAEKLYIAQKGITVFKNFVYLVLILFVSFYLTVSTTNSKVIVVLLAC